MKTTTELEGRKWYRLWKVIYFIIGILILIGIFRDIISPEYICSDGCYTLPRSLGYILGHTLLMLIITAAITELLRRIIYYVSLGSFNPPKK